MENFTYTLLIYAPYLEIGLMVGFIMSLIYALFHLLSGVRLPALFIKLQVLYWISFILFVWISYFNQREETYVSYFNPALKTLLSQS